MNLLARVTVGVAAVLFAVVLGPSPVLADSSSLPALTMREVKVTGDEFVVLQANTNIADLSSYWLGYSSTDTTTNIVPTQQLPAIRLASGQAILLTSDGVQTCDASYTTKLSPSLSDTKGVLEVRQLTNTSATTSVFTTIDRVNWTKPSSTATTTDNLDLRKENGLSTPVWYHLSTNFISTWAVADLQGCSLVVPQSGSIPAQTVVTWIADDTDPPAVILSLEDDDPASLSSGPFIPLSDVGLKPPQVTELLPNPSGTGNDNTDEYIELYNSNDTGFDLSGFVLQAGATTKHNFTFPSGTMLPAKTSIAFYSADTDLSLSNTNGQAALLDPFGTLLSQSSAYGSAKDGQAWALAKGEWYWTTKPTPGAANVIDQTGSSSGKSNTKVTATKLISGSVKGASTTTAGLSPASSVANQTAEVTSIHPWTLALVVVLAVAYGLYEYRLDVANHIYQFRKHRAARRANR